jgi:hypothetical protein
MSNSQNIFSQVQKLRDDARITKGAHFAAKERKRRIYRILGMGGIFFNILIATGLFDVWFPDRASLYIKAAAVFASAFVAVQTLLNFQKEAEVHGLAGYSYTTVQRRVDFLIAEFKDGHKTIEELVQEYRKLMEQYLEINEVNKNVIPDDKDFAKVRKVLKAPQRNSLIQAPESKTEPVC